MKKITRFFTLLTAVVLVISCLTACNVPASSVPDSSSSSQPTAPKMSGVDFTGKEIRYQLESIMPTAANTVEAWIKVSPDVGAKRVGFIFGGYENYSSHGYSLEISTNGNPRLYWNEGEATALFTDVDVRTGEWLHLAVVRDVQQNCFICYVNGAEASRFSDSIGTVFTPDSLYSIGSDRRSEVSAKNPFNGYISSVSVFGDARTPEEIAADMKTLPTGNVDNLLASWDLSKGGTKITDLGPNGYNAHVEHNDVWIPYDQITVDDGDFMLVAVPDTQIIAKKNNNSLNVMMKWIADNAEKYNISFVMGLGDITDNNAPLQYKVASAAYELLDGIVPYSVIIGNHDMTATAGVRNTKGYNSIFPLSRFQEMPTFGGSYDDKSDNTYHLLSAGGIDMLIFAVEYGPRNEIVDWMHKVIQQYPDRKVIYTSHYVLSAAGKIPGSLTTEDSTYGTYNSPKSMFENFLTKYDNIMFSIGGHVKNDDLHLRVDEGLNGNHFFQIMANAQALGSSFNISFDEGMILLMGVSEQGKKISFYYFSPERNAFYCLQNTVTIDINDDGSYEKTYNYEPIVPLGE